MNFNVHLMEWMTGGIDWKSLGDGKYFHECQGVRDDRALRGLCQHLLLVVSCHAEHSGVEPGCRTTIDGQQNSSR